MEVTGLFPDGKDYFNDECRDILYRRPEHLKVVFKTPKIDKQPGV